MLSFLSSCFKKKPNLADQDANRATALDLELKEIKVPRGEEKATERKRVNSSSSSQTTTLSALKKPTIFIPGFQDQLSPTIIGIILAKCDLETLGELAKCPGIFQHYPISNLLRIEEKTEEDTFRKSFQVYCLNAKGIKKRKELNFFINNQIKMLEEQTSPACVLLSRTIQDIRYLFRVGLVLTAVGGFAFLVWYVNNKFHEEQDKNAAYDTSYAVYLSQYDTMMEMLRSFCDSCLLFTSQAIFNTLQMLPWSNFCGKDCFSFAPPRWIFSDYHNPAYLAYQKRLNSTVDVRLLEYFTMRDHFNITCNSSFINIIEQGAVIRMKARESSDEDVDKSMIFASSFFLLLAALFLPTIFYRKVSKKEINTYSVAELMKYMLDKDRKKVHEAIFQLFPHQNNNRSLFHSSIEEFQRKISLPPYFFSEKPATEKLMRDSIEQYFENSEEKTGQVITLQKRHDQYASP